MGAPGSNDWSSRVDASVNKSPRMNIDGPTMQTPEFHESGPKNTARTIVLAHGSGVGIHSPFMTAFADGLADLGFGVVRFEFPYMTKIRQSERRQPPDREPVLVQSWHAILNEFSARKLIIGGKSLGGRIASLVADEASVDGLICLGYPFHAPGKETTANRTQHLVALRTPTLIFQGTRDPFGTVEDVESYPLSPSIRLHWLEDGDHNFKPRKSSGTTEEANWRSAIKAIANFADLLP